MHVPAEIAPYLTPENLTHLGEGLEHYIGSKIGGAIGARVFKAVRRKLLPFLDRYDDVELIKRRLEGLEDFVAGFQSERDKPPESEEASRSEAEVTAQNVNDPAFDDFVSEACEAAMQSPDEAMRLLFGRIAALRSYVPTSSVLALRYHEALALTRRLSAPQLWALTMVYMLTSRALAPPKMALREIEAYLDHEYYPVLSYLAQQAWNSQDLQHLTFLNAITRNQTYEMMERSGESRFRRVFHAGGEYWPIPQGEPVRGQFLELADQFDSEHGHNGRSVGPYAVTAVGASLGGIVFQQLHDQLVKGAAA